MLLNNVRNLELEREFAIKDLLMYEELIYDAIGDKFNYYSVAMSFKYLGCFQERLERLCYNEYVINIDVYRTIKDYLNNVLTSDCYNNMYDRMKVSGEYERI